MSKRTIVLGVGLLAASGLTWAALRQRPAVSGAEVSLKPVRPERRASAHLGGELGAVWDYDAQLSLATSAASTPISRTALHGVLSVLRTESGLRVRLRDPKLEQQSDQPNPASPSLEPIERQLAQPFEVTCGPHGEAADFRFATNVEAFSSRLLRSMLAYAQIVRDPNDPASTWEARESEPSGDFLMHYAADAAGAISLQKLRAERWAMPTAGLGLRAQEPSLVSGSGQAQIDGTGMITELSYDEHDSISVPALLAVSELDAVTHFALDHARPGTEAAPAEASLGPARRMDDDTVTAGHDYWADLSRIGGRRIADIGKELADARATGDAKTERAVRARSFVAASALLRRDPSEVTQATRVIHEGGPDAKFFVNALGSAGSKEAAAALTGLLQGEREAAPTREILRALGNVEHPAPETLTAMTQRFGDHEVGGFAQLMTGALAHSSEQSEPDVASAAAAALLNALAGEQNPLLIADTLRALGNAGDPRAVEVAARYAKDANPLLRSAAAQAVRRVVGSEADALLVELAADPEATVRDSAMNAALDRLPSIVLTAAVEQLARVDPEASVRRDAVRVLVEWQHDSESARDTLMWVAANDANDKLRQVAAEGLQRYN